MIHGVYETANEEETRAVAEKLARVLEGDEVILLMGEFGAGKTVFVQGLVRGLGGDEREVSSPSFVIAQAYTTRVPVVHIDLYRIEEGDELFHAGILDYVASPGICVVEWAEKLLPYIDQGIQVVIEILSPTRRRIHISRYIDPEKNNRDEKKDHV